jgi:hypothetical protein
MSLTQESFNKSKNLFQTIDNKTPVVKLKRRRVRKNYSLMTQFQPRPREMDFLKQNDFALSEKQLKQHHKLRTQPLNGLTRVKLQKRS